MAKDIKRPSDTAFTQQRLRAWRPILTPRFVIPSLFILGFFLLPFGIALFISSEKLTEIVADYTYCQNVLSTTLTTDGLSSSSNDSDRQKMPGLTRWAYDPNTQKCDLEINVPETIHGPIFLYYELGNYYQNYRKYVSSVEPRQLKGEALPYSSLGSCYPLIGPDDDNVKNQKSSMTNEEKDKLPVYYPCGSIADSTFLDEIGTNLTSSASGQVVIQLSSSNISWAVDSEKYKFPGYKIDQIRVPPSWQKRYRTGALYPDEASIRKWVVDNEHFHVWMRTSPFPTFRKLYAKNLNTLLPAGQYVISVYLYTNLIPFNATKSIVITNLSWQGGKNNFLGLTYLISGVTLIMFGLIFLIIHYFIKRDVGDYRWLSWNQEASKSKLSSSNTKSSFSSPKSSSAAGSSGLLHKIFRRSSS